MREIGPYLGTLERSVSEIDISSSVSNESERTNISFAVVVYCVKSELVPKLSILNNSNVSLRLKVLP